MIELLTHLQFGAEENLNKMGLHLRSDSLLGRPYFGHYFIFFSGGKNAKVKKVGLDIFKTVK